MSIRARSIAIGLSLLVFVALCPLVLRSSALVVPSTGPTKEVCRARVVNELTKVHDEYRSVLFGTVRGDDGKFYSKTGGVVAQERKGIFETKKRLTSELVQPLVESYRVFRCRSLAICKAVNKSSLTKVGGTAGSDPTENISQVLGCVDVPIEIYPQCQFAETNANTAATEMTGECGRLIAEMLNMEKASLKAAVAYDTGYRSLLQFAGMTEGMVKDMPTRNFEPVRNMVNMLGRLHQIPCFSGQCDMPNNDDLKP